MNINYLEGVTDDCPENNFRSFMNEILAHDPFLGYHLVKPVVAKSLLFAMSIGI